MPREKRNWDDHRQHLLMQGERGLKIFEKEEDKSCLLRTFARYLEDEEMKFYGFCVFDNHAHFVIEAREPKRISRLMQRLNASYHHAFAAKTGGFPVFRDRYENESITSDQMLLNVLRYLHQEPVHRGLCEEMADYRYSSYRLYLRPWEDEYHLNTKKVYSLLQFAGGFENYMSKGLPSVSFDKKAGEAGEVDMSKTLESGPAGQGGKAGPTGEIDYRNSACYGQSIVKGSYVKVERQPAFLEETPLKYGRPIDEAEQILKEHLGGSLQRFKYMSTDDQMEFLRRMKHEEEISIIQLSKITGVSRGIIQRLK